MGSPVRFRVLGPLVAEAPHPLDLRGPRHRAVLARLLIARGRVVPTAVLIDDLWENPPDGALGAVQTFVAALRRALEPDRPPRTPPRLLVTEGPGYALRPDAGAVDAWCFEAEVTGAPELSRVDAALARWRGPAYADFADAFWARAEVSRLDELRLLARERRAEALLALGRPEEVVPDLTAHTDTHPWREHAWHLLALALYRTHRQGDALATLRRARATLAADLGVDPGPALRTLEADVLAHAPHLDAPARTAPRSTAAALVGRDEDAARLLAAADRAVAERRTVFALLTGDSGIGKTALAESVTAALAGRGWTTAWGANPPETGLPPAWPWTRILAALGITPPDAESPFAWRRAVVDRLADRAPLVLVLDDLHRAGEDTLAVLGTLAADPPAAPVLLIAAHRERPESLTGFLGQVAGTEPVRVHLTGVPVEATTDLVRAATGAGVDPGTAAALHRRAGGNPFFLRELARLHAEGGDLDGVPPGVRDVVLARLAALPEPVRRVLRHAAVLGADLDLLDDDPDLLEPLAAATAAGFLTDTGPAHRFTHDLIRDAVSESLPGPRRARLHADTAARLERLRPDAVDALAHHHLHTGTAESAARAVGYARTAAENAERAFAPHQAARLWRTALTAHDRAGTGDPRTRLDLVMGHVRALAYTGDLDRARRERATALADAERLGDPALTARVLGSFTVPALWTDPDDPELSRQVVAVTERTLAALPAGPGPERARLLATLALELRNTDTPRAARATREAEATAPDDPELRDLIRNARVLTHFDRAGLAADRARLAADLVGSAQVGHRILGHLVAVQAHSALADLSTAGRHADAADRLAADHGIPLVAVFTDFHRALRLAITGGDAEPAYRAAAARLPGTGMTGLADGLLDLALLCDRLQRGLPARDGHFGQHEPWCRPLFTAPDDLPPDPPHDLLLEARTCLQARTALGRGDRPAVERLHDALLPAADELAGAGSGLITLGPVAAHLADLAAALGRTRQATEHRERALAVAEKAGSPHGIALQRAALHPRLGQVQGADRQLRHPRRRR
ncbi:AAA family ATPase [Actinokineospora sp. PR83]|uniref:BTAD domain-containing putative transcriptional regulator n=1 Tax=Actinokineospora sp. PR83 TaxID=2884908 RepID=UPI001F22FD71|nr:BTAD domain-containing putative transcriptional regulator [Actinokineospora sp. PR83]MCG8919128.1 AAA family ATPase [Actinokineospora sp. PR83]